MANRRKFLVSCSAAAVGSTLLPAGLLAAPSRFKTVSTAGISFEIFAALVNTEFEVRDDEGNHAVLELIRAKSWSPQVQDPNAEDAANEKFTLVFQGLVTEELHQKTYHFEHPAIGSFELFITQVGQKGPLVSKYEAVFNRPVRGSSERTLPRARSTRRISGIRNDKIN